MILPRRWLLLVIAVSLLGADAPPPETATSDAPDGDAARLRGSWRIVRYECNGEAQLGLLTEGRLESRAFFVFDGEQAVVRVAWRNDGEFRSVDTEIYGYRTDPAPAMSTFDLRTYGTKRPSDPDSITKGIYRLRGHNLTICLASGNQDRPKTFEPKKGDDQVLLVLKREKP